jgi:hypothetical protein
MSRNPVFLIQLSKKVLTISISFHSSVAMVTLDVLLPDLSDSETEKISKPFFFIFKCLLFPFSLLKCNDEDTEEE